MARWTWFGRSFAPCSNIFLRETLDNTSIFPDSDNLCCQSFSKFRPSLDSIFSYTWPMILVTDLRWAVLVSLNDYLGYTIHTVQQTNNYHVISYSKEKSCDHKIKLR